MSTDSLSADLHSHDFPVHATPAALLAAARGLELTTEQAGFDTTGLDFLVVHARDPDGTPWIVRTPRRSDVVASARVEARVLALVRPRLPVAVPDWQVHTDDVIAYRRISGVPAVSVTPEGPVWNVLDPAAPSETFIKSFAGALAALQAIAPDTAIAAGVPASSVAEAREELAQALQTTRAALEPSDGVWARWQRWLADDAVWPQHVALAHGDLHPGHLLLEADGRLVGILDWTEARVGDPSVDLAMFYGCFGRAALLQLLREFEAAGGVTWPGLVAHAVERWAAFPALGAAWALRTGNNDTLAFARGMLAGVSPDTGA